MSGAYVSYHRKGGALSPPRGLVLNTLRRNAARMAILSLRFPFLKGSRDERDRTHAALRGDLA